MEKAKVISVANLPTWYEYFKTQKVSPDNAEILKVWQKSYPVNYMLNNKISLWHGDITLVKADAIVNSTNPKLTGGGGADGDIHRVAGDELLRECESLGGCKIGEAKITRGYNLPADYVIHTVSSMTGKSDELRQCYKSCLELMMQYTLKTIVFPCIGTGLYGYDPEEAAHIAACEVRAFLYKQHQHINRIVFCVYTQESLKIYEQILQRYFPVKIYEP